MIKLVDVKPIGAFIEYTLKPLIDYSHDLLETMKEQGIDANRLFNQSVILFIFDKLITLVQNVIITGLICLTLYAYLNTIR